MAEMMSDYAKSIGVMESDAHTARGIRLSVADCKHLVRMLQRLNWGLTHQNIPTLSPFGSEEQKDQAIQWNKDLIVYLRGAV